MRTPHKIILMTSGVGGSPGIIYLAQWDFITNEAAPVASPHIENGASLTIVQPGTAQMSIAIDALVVPAPVTPGFNVSYAVGPGQLMAAATTLVAKLNRSTASTNLNPMAAWSISATPNSSSRNSNQIAAGIYFEASGALNVPVGDGATTTTLQIDTYTVSTDYVFAVVQRSSGGYFVLGRSALWDQSSWRLLWVEPTAIFANTTLYPTINSYSAAYTVDYIHTLTSVGLLTSDYGVATVNQSNPATGTTYTHTLDGIIDLQYTPPGSPAAGDTIELRARYQDASNFWSLQAVRNAGNTDYDYKLVQTLAGTPGTYATLSSGGSASILRLRLYADSIKGYVKVGKVWKAVGSGFPNSLFGATLCGPSYSVGSVQAITVYPQTSSNYDTVAPAMALTSPQPYQTFQRTMPANTGTITISGTLTGGFATPATVQARWQGGAWTTIATGVISVFGGSLTGQASGQGLLEVRVANPNGNGYVVQSVQYVGIGDIFIVMGQSNAGGRATNSQVYSHATLKAAMFGNTYLWGNLVDPTDTGVRQVDAVSLDTGVGGSLWPLVATAYMASQGVPCAFVPCALGGTSITQWLPGADRTDRTTLYGSMVYRARQVGGCAAVLKMQGEADFNMAQATYEGYLQTFGNAVLADLGVPVIDCKHPNYSTNNMTVINAAIGATWGTNNISRGPDLFNMSITGLHLTTDPQMLQAASNNAGEDWWTRIKAVLGI